MSFPTYEELEKCFADEQLHPGDLKSAVEGYLNQLLDPVRKVFSDPGRRINFSLADLFYDQVRVHKALFHLFQIRYSEGYCSTFHVTELSHVQGEIQYQSIFLRVIVLDEY